MRAWLMLAKGDERQHGGNRGYSDILDSRYVWDTTVPNCGRPQAGDLIAIWDGDTLLGASVIERISETDAEKLRLHCPACHSTKIKKRKTLVPDYRCHVQKCRAEFNERDLIETRARVKRYEAYYPDAWLEFAGVVDRGRLAGTCLAPKSQHSIRELHLDSFLRLLSSAERSQLRRFGSLVNSCEPDPKGGHVPRLVRARVGQANFRARLLSRFGSCCAISGPCPLESLEAAHLYSYANFGVHHEGGGLLLRRDIHRLFDLGLIAVEVATMTIEIAADIREFPHYSPFHGQRLNVDVKPREKRWLQIHWQQHHSTRLEPDYAS